MRQLDRAVAVKTEVDFLPKDLRQLRDEWLDEDVVSLLKFCPYRLETLLK